MGLGSHISKKLLGDTMVWGQETSDGGHQMYPKKEALLWEGLGCHLLLAPIYGRRCRFGRIYSVHTVKKNSSQNMCLGKENEVLVGGYHTTGNPYGPLPTCTLDLGAVAATLCPPCACLWDCAAPFPAGVHDLSSWYFKCALLVLLSSADPRGGHLSDGPGASPHPFRSSCR